VTSAAAPEAANKDFGPVRCPREYASETPYGEIAPVRNIDRMSLDS
jgi:hypothetical protein